MFNKIRNWAQERNLVAGSTPQTQLVKLVEEFVELAGGITEKKDDVVKDSIGDAIVVLTIIAAQHDLDMDDCIQAAYDEIKDRKGKMVDGVFVKEADLPQDIEPQPTEQVADWRSVLGDFGLDEHDYKVERTTPHLCQVVVTVPSRSYARYVSDLLWALHQNTTDTTIRDSLRYGIQTDGKEVIVFRAEEFK